MQNFIDLSAAVHKIVLTERKLWWKQYCRRYRRQ